MRRIKAIPTKPVFKIKNKQDGSERYKARIVMKGFLMIPGVNYTELFSPVTMEVGVQCVIGISLYFSMKTLCKMYLWNADGYWSYTMLKRHF